MPYPFTQFPTLREFIDRATSDYKSRIESIAYTGPRGETKNDYLVRDGLDGKPRFAMIPDIDEEKNLTPHVLRSLCVQLELPLKDFGLTLG